MMNLVTIPRIYWNELENLSQEEEGLVITKVLDYLFYEEDFGTKDEKLDSLIHVFISLLETVPYNTHEKEEEEE